MHDTLTTNDKFQIAIESGLQLVPWVGGALSTAYFSIKQEKRLKRIESFYAELSEQMINLESAISSLGSHDEESLVALIERLNDEIEKESSIQKRNYFKTFFISILQTPTLANNYDERRMLLDSLASITHLEFQVLLNISEYKESVQEFITGIDPSLFEGAIARLETLGMLTARYNTTSFIGQSNAKKHTSISDFGKKFISFCID